MRDAGYIVDWRVLNTEEFGGLPQHRPRWYLLGVHKDHVRAGWEDSCLYSIVFDTDQR